MPQATDSIKCSSCNRPASGFGDLMQEREPHTVLKECLAHRRLSRWQSIAPPSGYGCWGCPGCGHDVALARITVSTGRGQFVYEHEVYIGDDEYDREDGLYIGVSADHVADYIQERAWDAHLSGEFDISVDDEQVPDDFEDFMNNDTYEVVRQHVYDHFMLHSIECYSCEATIRGDID